MTDADAPRTRRSAARAAAAGADRRRTAAAAARRPPAPDGIPKAHVTRRKRRQISLVWIIPIVAVLVGAYLVFHALRTHGPTIDIEFKTAEGLEAGKTKIKYKNVDIGTVQTITLGKDKKGVIVTAQMTRNATDLLVEDTRFWIVKPRIAGGQISGLTTLLSGSYIGMDIGKSTESQREFVGLDQQPSVTTDEPGREFLLHATGLGLARHRRRRSSSAASRSARSPRQSRRRRQGRDGARLHPLAERALRDAEHALLGGERHRRLDRRRGRQGRRRSRSRRSSSAASRSRRRADEPPGARRRERRAVHAVRRRAGGDEALRRAAREVHRVLQRLDPRAVGRRAGRVPRLRHRRGPLDRDGVRSRDARVPLPGRVRAVSRRAAGAHRARREEQAAADRRRRSSIERAIEKRGLRAQLRTGNLLTGQKYLALDFVKDAPKVAAGPMRDANGNRIIPTVPGSFEELQESLSSIAKKIDKIPFEQLATEIRRTLQELQRSLKDADQLIRNVDQNVAPGVADALTEVSRTMKSANEVLASDAPLQQDLRGTLTELNRAAASLRLLTDYLQRHPESLIRGKAPDTPFGDVPRTPPSAQPAPSPAPAHLGGTDRPETVP